MQDYRRFARAVDHRRRIASLATLSLALLAGGCASPAPQSPPPVAPQPPAPMADVVPSWKRPPPLPDAPLRLRSDAPTTYVVQPGDTLWGIASRFLQDPWQWPEIWYVNNQIANPHRIYPGDILQLVYVDGRATVQRAIVLTPRIRELGSTDAIPTVPLDAIRDFLRGPRLVTEDELANAPYVLAFADERVVGGSGDLAYVRRLAAGPTADFAAVRRGDPYIDPDDGEQLGFEAIPVAELQTLQPGDPASMLIARAWREAKRGDFLLPLETGLPTTDFYPHAPSHAVGGHIISVFDGVSQIGQYQIVTINRGSDQGLEVGHVLDILQSGAVVDDPMAGNGATVKLPDQYAGDLLIFKTTPRLSYGLVMRVVRAAHVMDRVEAPQLGG
jgi:hypothetical protein